MSRIIGLTGNEAIAYAVKQCNVDVVAAYPITPQTIMVEAFSEYVANGQVNAEFVCVESEHSAMSACVGASLTGARVFTATASQGLALMHEMLYIASSLRCPIVMGVANRALSAPINIHGDHSDMMGSRDCGWVQVYCENAQEAYDWVIQTFRIAENKDVQLPVSVNLDGFILTHSMEDVNVLEDEDVKSFIPSREFTYRIDPEKPITFGPICLTDYYFEFKMQQEDAMGRVQPTLKKVTQDFRKLTGRRYGVLETYEMKDAETAIICLGSTAGTAKAVAKELRKKGKKVGVVKLSLYRPFPAREVVSATEGLKSLAVLDRACSFGALYGSLCSDVISAFYGKKKVPKIFNVVYGLGGRDTTSMDIKSIFMEALKVAKTRVIKKPLSFVGVRE